jgi:bifunctional UDP-N-acetylglucosamine pyrophosphorylase/glucosamine-1-phosphate N-acetyltransferase
MTEPKPMLTAVILAAGKGTRMKSERAKVLHEICGRPLVAHVIDRALEVGADQIVVVVGHQAAAVEAKVRALFPNAPLKFALQEQQLGTGHAVMAARSAGGFANGSVLVLSGDVPLIRTESLKSLVALHRESNIATALITSELGDPCGYGRIVRDPAGRFDAIVEEKDATETQRKIKETNAGIYCFGSAFLSSALDQISPKNAQGEYYLTDVVRHGGVVTSSVWHQDTAGINDRLQLAQAEGVMSSRIRRRHLLEGVTIRGSRNCNIDVTVTIGMDTELGPSVSLHGATQIGKNVKIGQGTIIIDSTIADGVEIRPYCHIEGATVGPGSIIGPFARLRLGTELADGVHIGNFVETKKARIGSGSKANHLTYLGDTVIGKGSNIGAGTITCNYDGIHKHETRLGDGVFVGSDTQFVAPVTVADGAYIGAGSTITKDVPADALAFTRSPQVVKEGWAKSKRKKAS